MDNKWNVILVVLLLIIASATLFVAVQSFRVAGETRDIAERTSEITEQSSQLVEQTKQLIEETNQTLEETQQILEQTQQILEQTSQSAEQTNQILEQTRQILERSYELQYRGSLPTISAVSETYYDSEEHIRTEKIMVYNGGGPLTDFEGSAYAMMKVWFPGMGMETNIPIIGYFGFFWDAEYTGKSQGLLLTVFREDNLSDYWSMESDFREAASDDGYQPLMYTLSILSVDYCDNSGQRWTEYFSVNLFGSSPMGESYAQEILGSAGEIGALAESAGLSLYIWELDGQELWEWYKAAILKDFS